MITLSLNLVVNKLLVFSIDYRRGREEAVSSFYSINAYCMKQGKTFVKMVN